MKYLSLVLMFLMSFSAWSQSAEQVRDAEAINALIRSVKTLADADLSCVSSIDCVTIEVGAKPCGGPAGFQITSRFNLNSDVIDYLSEQSQIKAQAFNRKYRMMSTCSVRMPPIPRCLKNICQE